MATFNYRSSQQEILTYSGGKMGISAVPGAGKTFTLSALAAQIIGSGQLSPDQEVLIVTLVNSAVDNFTARIGKMIEQRGLIPQLGYRVRTLHGLAHDIVREKPALAGLDERFGIIDDREADSIRKDAAQAWLSANPYALDDYFSPDIDENKRDWHRRQHLPEIAHSIALAFIRSAKDARLSPEALRKKLDESPPLPLAEMGWAIYADYQRALTYRGAVDFDDLIRLAYTILESDPEYLARLQYRFPFVLEDEAQDSSEIQQKILGMIGHENWVRVGDPNQAIFETFTTANPKLLKQFIARKDVIPQQLPESGRSQQAIINLANQLIDWVNHEHPIEDCRDSLTTPHIKPTVADDPQPNPVMDKNGIRLSLQKQTPESEIEAIVDSIAAWLPSHADQTVAILVPRNARGVEVVETLKKRGIDYLELINSTNSTRMTAGALANILAYLADPSSASKLSKTYQVWRRAWRDESANKALYERVSELIRKARQVEEYLFPAGDMPSNWLEALRESEPEEVLSELENFQQAMRNWQGITLIPIDQMILTLAQELFTEPAELALAHKLALVLRKAANDHSDWRLPELTAELGVIAKNERRFIGFSADDSGFDPERHKGKVVVTTMHKAKGLEWDRVYLMSVNNYDFPSLQPFDNFIAEKWFVRNQLNLEAEALAQMQALINGSEFDWYTEGAASLSARVDYARERLRLLYVAITRAKRELILTWNTGRRGDAQPSIPLQALADWQASQK